MYYIGVDLGGTNISIGLVNERGDIVDKRKRLTLVDRGYEIIIKDIYEICLELIENNNIKISDICCIGIGSPGAPDIENGILIYSNNLKFRNVPLREEMKKYMDIPIYIENDANCAAFGEAISGATKGYKNSITVTLGTGIGGGIIINNKIYSGSNYMGTEIGHMSINANGEMCSCGRRGCWELYSSATAIIREAVIVATKHPDSQIFQMVNGDIKLLNAKIPFDACENNDIYAKELVERYLYYLAVGTSNLINIFQPEIIAFGGGVSAQGDKLINPLINLVKDMVYGNVLKTEIVMAKLGNDAGIVGAAMLGRS